MKPLHLIIDGSDNLGKTTVVKMLSMKLGLPIIKMPNMTEYIGRGATEEFSKLFNETIIQFREYPFILDRGFPSSLVYSSIFNREFNLSYIEETEKLLDPTVFIFTGRHASSNGKISYHSFCEDPIFNEEEKREIDEAFCNLANNRLYNLIEVWGKHPSFIVQSILERI